MENQKILLFRQKNRWGLTVLSIVLCLVLSPALSAMLFVPNVLTILPVLLLLLLTVLFAASYRWVMRKEAYKE